MARYKTCLAQECCCGIRPIASVLRRTAHPELLTSRRRIPRATTKMRPLRLQMWLKFNILERKKKRKKKLPPLCSLQNSYLWPSFLSYLFYMCARSNLIPFNYEIVWMNDVIQELYKHEWQEDLPYSQASACNNSDVVRVSVSRLVRWHRSCSEWDSVTLSWIGAICTSNPVCQIKLF